jgi:hypothetical protein
MVPAGLSFPFDAGGTGMAKADPLGSVSKKAALLAILALLTLALVVVQARPAHAAANKTVQGRGSTTQFLCPTGTSSADIAFFATKDKGNVNGGGDVFGSGTFKDFNLTSGTINQANYSLKGIFSIFFTPTCAGFPAANQATVTLTGDCGTAVTIHYTDSDGERGDFLGNVGCT